MDTLIARRYQLFSLLAIGLAVFLFRPKIVSFPTPDEQDTALPSNVIGIELGEAYSRVGIYRHSSFEIFPDDQGRTAIPSYVSFLDSPDQPPLVGFEAKEQANGNIENTIYDLRLLLGQNSSNLALQKLCSELKYEVTMEDERPVIKINQNGNLTLYNPEEIQALMIAKLKSMAETHLNTTVTHAAIAVPSDFSDLQRQAILNSANLAGINVLRLVNETFAVGVAYRVDLRPCDEDFGRYECRYVVYEGDGRGQTELAAFWSDGGLFEVLGSVKSTGEDLTTRNLEESPIDISQQKALLSRPDTNIKQSPEDQARSLQDLLTHLLAKSNTTKGAIDGIIINTSADPHQPLTTFTHIKTILQSYFSNTEVLEPPEYLHFKYDEAIVCGTAKQGYMLSDSYPQVDVSIGYDSALSLGIELNNGAFLRVSGRGELLPLRAKAVLSTTNPGQEKVTIRIFEGEREIASKNKYLGVIEFDLDKTQTTRQKLEVKFDVLVNEILEVEVRLGAWDGLEVGKLVVPVRTLRYKQGEIEEIVQAGARFHDEDMRWLEDNKELVPNGVEMWKSERS